MRKVYIMLGGSVENLPDNWQTDTQDGDWIGVDHGALLLIENGITPTISLGDFDSVTPEEKEKIISASDHVITVPAEKDLTDTELAVVTAIEEDKYDQFILYAATGTRLDHMINTFSIPIQERFRPYAEKIIFRDRTNLVRYFLPGKHSVTPDPSKSYVAFGPMTPVKKLFLGKGLKYTLDYVDIPHPYMFASNRFTGSSAEFSFETGLLMVIQSKD